MVESELSITSRVRQSSSIARTSVQSDYSGRFVDGRIENEKEHELEGECKRSKKRKSLCHLLATHADGSVWRSNHWWVHWFQIEIFFYSFVYVIWKRDNELLFSWHVYPFINDLWLQFQFIRRSFSVYYSHLSSRSSTSSRKRSYSRCRRLKRNIWKIKILIMMIMRKRIRMLRYDQRFVILIFFRFLLWYFWHF